MQTIMLLMGPHGSGKTTLTSALDRQGAAVRLRQYTTRPKRHGENDEYKFVSGSQANVLWRYIKAGSEYGFAEAELANLPDGSIGVVAVHTEVIDSLKQRPSGLHLLTVGLDTLASHADQISRVNNLEGRVQSVEAFEESTRVARGQDICLSGDLSSVLTELTQIIKQLRDYSP